MNKYTDRLVPLLLLFGGAIYAQEVPPEQVKALRASRQLTWEANRQLEEEEFVNAEATYRKAISKSSENATAPYNLGNALYSKENYSEAFGRFKQAGEKAPDKSAKHNSYHNMGNVFMKNKEYEKAVEAYKEALRNDPTDEETRYNLALAKEMLKKQQNEQQDNQDKDNQDQQDQKDKNQDQKDQGDQQDKNQQQNQDQQKDKGDQGDQQKEENKEGEGDEKQEQQKQPQSEEEQEGQQAPRPNQLSPQQIRNLLEAMQNEERKVQEKLDAQKVKGIPTKSKKDW